MATNTTFDDSDSDFEDSRRSRYGLDSDDESLIEFNTTADRSFSQRDHPQEAFEESPLRQSQDKAQEVARERQASRSTAVAAALPSGALGGQPAGFDTTTPLLDAGPAPPDYYQATEGRGRPPAQYAQGHSGTVNYGSISSHSSSRGQGNVSANAEDELYRDDTHDRPLRNAASFGSDHSLVRNGLFDEQGALNGRIQEPQSMQNSAQAPPHPPHSEAQAHQATSAIPSNIADGHRRDEELGRDPAPPYPHWHHHHYHPAVKKKQKRGRKLCCYCFSLIIVLVLIFSVLGYSPIGSNHDSPHTRLPVQSPHQNKSKIPEHQHTSECAYNSYSEYKSIDFYDPGNFSFLEMIEPTSYLPYAPMGARISGKVRISPFSYSSEEHADQREVAIRVWVHVASTSPWIVEDLNYDKDDGAFQLGFPEIRLKQGIPAFTKTCLDFAVLIQVRSDIEISSWDLTTAHLNIEVEDGIFAQADTTAEVSNLNGQSESSMKSAKQKGLAIMGDTSMYALLGSVSVAYWSSRRTRIITTSGQIHGTYALRDSLEVESQSGFIDIGVTPEKAAEDDPSDAAADFSVKSHSGSVDVDCPSFCEREGSSIPVRKYRTRVETWSSTIDGQFLLGTSTSITSHSGTINADILPISANAWNSDLITSTHSSTTSLNLLKALTADEDGKVSQSSKWDMGRMSSSHKSHSGSISVRYDEHWTGLIEGRSNSGSISVKGRDVEIIDKDDRSGHKRVKAKKGSGDSHMTFKTQSSSVDVVIGDTW